MNNGLENLSKAANTAEKEVDWDKAIALWADIRRSHPDAPIGVLRGAEALIRQRQFGEASDLLEGNFDRFYDRFVFRMSYAKFLSRRGDYRNSFQEFGKVIDDFPNQKETISCDPIYRQTAVNFLGIKESSQFLRNISHIDRSHLKTTACPAGSDKDYIFVSGLPRSGTSAFGRMLNQSPDICLFVELYGPYFSYDPACFSKSTLERTIPKSPHGLNADLMARQGNARFVGDKRPLFHYFLSHSMNRFRGSKVKVFHILRSVNDVCQSYQQRAENLDDHSWDRLRDASIAVHDFNIMNEFLLTLNSEDQYPGHEVSFFSYDQVFSNPDISIQIFQKLGINIDRRLRGAVENFIRRSEGVFKKRRNIRDDIKDIVSTNLDSELAKNAEAITSIKVF